MQSSSTFKIVEFYPLITDNPADIPLDKYMDEKTYDQNHDKFTAGYLPSNNLIEDIFNSVSVD